MSERGSAKPATQRQLAYLRDLAVKRCVNAPAVATALEASAAIAQLLARPAGNVCGECGTVLVPDADSCPCEVWKAAL